MPHGSLAQSSTSADLKGGRPWAWFRVSAFDGHATLAHELFDGQAAFAHESSEGGHTFATTSVSVATTGDSATAAPWPVCSPPTVATGQVHASAGAPFGSGRAYATGGKVGTYVHSYGQDTSSKTWSGAPTNVDKSTNKSAEKNVEALAQ